jgi:hypothetical protein
MLKTLAAAAALCALAACDKSGSTAPTSTSLVTVTSPKAGSTVHVGDSLRVTWTVKSDPAKSVNAVDILLSPDDGKTWVMLNSGSIADDSPKWEKWDWKVTDSLYVPAQNKKIAITGATSRIKVEQYSTKDADMIGTTEAFTIAP